MTQLITDGGDVAGEEWAATMRSLTLDEQTDMLAAAVRLLRRPDAICGPLESELRVLADQAYLALGQSLES